MGRFSAKQFSASVASALMSGFILAVFAVTASAGQPARSPRELLKEAESFQKAGKLDGAIKDYRLFLQQYPNVAPVRSNLGAALAATGRYKEAIVEYQNALLLDNSPRIRLNLALAYYKASKLDEAVDNLKQVHAAMPGDLQPVLLLADCYLRLGQNKQVVTLLTPIRQANPNNLAVIYALGTALVRNGQADKGQVLINKIMGNGDSAAARLLLGTAKLMVKDYAGALKDLRKAVELDPHLPDVYSYYGVALLATGDQPEAQKAFRQALRGDPNDFQSNLNMGVLLRQDNKFEEALGYFKHALDVRPGDFGVLYQIASMELQMGQVDKARRDLEALVRISPNFTEAHVSLATAYYREKMKEQGDRERAIVEKLIAERQAAQVETHSK